MHLNHHLEKIRWSLAAPPGPSHHHPCPLPQPTAPSSHPCLRQGVGGAENPQPSAKSAAEELLGSLFPPSPSRNRSSSDSPLSQPSPLAGFPLTFKLMVFSQQQTILTKWVRGTAGAPQTTPLPANHLPGRQRFILSLSKFNVTMELQAQQVLKQILQHLVS